MAAEEATPPVIMLWLQAAAWLAAAVGVIFTALKFRTELKLAREQRKQDLRWRQADVGKSLNDEMQMDARAFSALQMLDYEEREYVVSETEKLTIKREDVRRALDPARFQETPTDNHIRDCFDALFYFMAIVQHYVKTTLTLPEDVAFPLDYYVPLLLKLKREVSEYLAAHNLWRTREYLATYPSWKDSA